MNRYLYIGSYQKPLLVIVGETYVLRNCNIACEVFEVVNGNVHYDLLDGEDLNSLDVLNREDFLDRFELTYEGYRHRRIGNRPNRDEDYDQYHDRHERQYESVFGDDYEEASKYEDGWEQLP